MIPKIIHQIWLGDKPSQFLLDCQQSIKDLHPTWGYRYYTNTDIVNNPLLSSKKQLILEFLRILPQCDGIHNPKALIADLLRLLIIYVHGGVYLDHDMFCIRPLDDLLHNDFIATEIRPGYIGEGIIGAAPLNKHIWAVIDDFIRMQPGPRRNVCMDLTGHCKRFGLRAFPQEYFCPHSKNQEYLKYHYTNNTRTIHCWKTIQYDINKLRSIQRQLNPRLSTNISR